MFKELIVQLFPNGRFIDRTQIKLGTTVARGGSTLSGKPLTKAAIITRPIKIFKDGSIGSDYRDFEASFFSEEMVDEWLYEIDTDYTLDPDHITDHHFNTAVLNAATTKMMKPTKYRFLRMGNIVLVSSADKGDIEDPNTYWLPDITLFVVGGEDEFGWFVESETPDTEPYNFTPVVNLKGNNENLWNIKKNL